MALYRMDGTISRLGQCEFDNNVVIYAYIEITDANGGRVLVKKAAVCVDVESTLCQGLTGSFFFDDLFISGRRLHCQMWGIRTAERTVVDGVDMRVGLARLHILRGILYTPLFGFGLLELCAGIGQWWSLISGSANRQKFLAAAQTSSARSLSGTPNGLKLTPLPERIGLRLQQAVLEAVRKRFQQSVR